MPPGWAAHQDQEGRVYYLNAETGESSWDPPAGACAWSIDYTYALGPEGHEYKFHSKVRMLDRSYTSVSSTVEALQEGTLIVEEGICVLFSASRGLYYLVWRQDRQDLADRICFPWNMDQVMCMGPVGLEDAFANRAALLEKDVYVSVTQAIEALNLGELDFSEPGWCVVFSESQQRYYLLFHCDKAADVAATFQPWRDPDEEAEGH
uniref:WW domain-containing protein n=1 Tax=Zooxanthella nutricula TaxID=1333877 RepID=A0A7S2JGN2_9DINO